MALVDILNETLTNFGDTDPAWRQFISDHKQYLINRSSVMLISPAYMQQYLYSLGRYLRSINYDPACAWIIRLINDIPTDIVFDASVGSLRIPPFTIIAALYTTYIAQKQASAA